MGPAWPEDQRWGQAWVSAPQPALVQAALGTPGQEPALNNYLGLKMKKLWTRENAMKAGAAFQCGEHRSALRGGWIQFMGGSSVRGVTRDSSTTSVQLHQGGKGI